MQILSSQDWTTPAGSCWNFQVKSMYSVLFLSENSSVVAIIARPLKTLYFIFLLVLETKPRSHMWMKILTSCVMLLVCFGQLKASLLEAFLLFYFKRCILRWIFRLFMHCISMGPQGYSRCCECDSRFMSQVILSDALYDGVRGGIICYS